MAESFDSKQLMAFLRRTGSDLRKTGEELRGEAQKLLDEVRDPANAQRVKDSLTELGHWFTRATTEAAEAIEMQVKRAESTLFRKGTGVGGKATTGAKRKAKTVGRRVATAAKRAGSRRPAAAKKPKKRSRS